MQEHGIKRHLLLNALLMARNLSSRYSLNRRSCLDESGLSEGSSLSAIVSYGQMSCNEWLG